MDPVIAAITQRALETASDKTTQAVTPVKVLRAVPVPHPEPHVPCGRSLVCVLAQSFTIACAQGRSGLWYPERRIRLRQLASNATPKHYCWRRGRKAVSRRRSPSWPHATAWVVIGVVLGYTIVPQMGWAPEAVH